MFHRNVGTCDRIARIALGLVLVPVGLFAFGGDHGTLAGLGVTAVGVIALATGVAGFCLLYVPLKISTVGRGACATWCRRSAPTA